MPVAAKPPKRKPPKDDALRDAVYDRVCAVVHDIISRRKAHYNMGLGRLQGREVFEAALDTLFAGLVKTPGQGFFRLPMGYGTFKVRRFKARPPRMMPTRDNLPVAPVAPGEARYHLRYTEGVTVRKALGTYRASYERHGLQRLPIAILQMRRRPGK